MNRKETRVFIELVRAGLWEKEVQLLPYQDIKWQEMYRLATEQSVLGLVLAGLEHSDVKPPKEILLQSIGEVQQIEQRNNAMNSFVAELTDGLRKKEIYCLLVKGQGIARCYERPLWRSARDVDLMVSGENYKKASDFLMSLASKVDDEVEHTKHLAFTIDGWEVELHGTLRSGLWRSLEASIDEVQNDVFYGGHVRSWMNGQSQVFLPAADEDVVFVFSHILQHFYKGGIGLRQICDWCRLLYTYRETLNKEILEERLRAAGVMTEWKAFGAFAVNYLGMSEDAMPFYSTDIKWEKKAERIMRYILETGNFGHNRDVSYQKKLKPFVRKTVTMWRQTKDNAKHFWIFPIDSVKAWWSIFVAGIKDAVNRC